MKIQYNLQGTLGKVRVYDNGSYADTDYTYSATTGKLTQRDFPEESSQHIRTSYSYDSAGRLQYETVTREAAGSTNLSRTTYAQTYSTGDHYSQQLRTEETGSGASWINSSRTTYQYDGMNRQDYEKREDYLSDPDPDWVQTYLIEQEYDKKGNRTRLDRNVTSGHETEYGQSMDLGYTYNTVNALTAISDADDANYECTVTCDANNNITLVAESVSTGGSMANLTTVLSYDWANRMETNTVSRYSSADKDMVYTKREHEYDAAGRLVNSTYKNWLGGEEEPTGDTVEHCYAKSKHIQNTDGSSNYGAVWHWAGVNVPESPVLRSPNADTASQVGYNQTDYVAPQRRTYLSPTSAGDERNLYGQGKPMAKDSSGGGLNWYEGIKSDTPDAQVLTLESRLDFDGTVAPTDLSRATDAREKGRIGIFGSQLSYAGSSARVTSEPLGRDLNPLGRGDGGAYVAGAVRLGVIAPRLPGNQAAGGTGNSVNNCGQCGGNPPINPPLPPFDPGQWPPRENPDPYWELNREEMRCVNEWASRCVDYHEEDCACPSQLNWACCPDACTRQEWVDHPYYCQRVKCECLDRGCQAPPAYTGSDADCALGGCCAEPDCDCLSQMVVRPPKDDPAPPTPPLRTGCCARKLGYGGNSPCIPGVKKHIDDFCAWLIGEVKYPTPFEFCINSQNGLKFRPCDEMLTRCEAKCYALRFMPGWTSRLPRWIQWLGFGACMACCSSAWEMCLPIVRYQECDTIDGKHPDWHGC